MPKEPISLVDALRAYVAACDVAVQAYNERKAAEGRHEDAELERKQAWHVLQSLNPKQGVYMVSGKALDISYHDYPRPETVIGVIV